MKLLHADKINAAIFFQNCLQQVYIFEVDKENMCHPEPGNEPLDDADFLVSLLERLDLDQ